MCQKSVSHMSRICQLKCRLHVMFWPIEYNYVAVECLFLKCLLFMYEHKMPNISYICAMNRACNTGNSYADKNVKQWTYLRHVCVNKYVCYITCHSSVLPESQ